MRKIEKIYMVTHRYDLPNLFTCLASIKYWYPNIEIVIIKNQNNGRFNLDFLKRYYNVTFLYETTYSYGKFYGSLEPFISGKNERFIIVDTDTAFTGRIIDFAETKTEDFVIDYEIQPIEKTKSLYWDSERIGEYISNFSDRWFTFNNGIMACMGNKIIISDFTDFMRWEKHQQPVILDSTVFPTYDQSAINVVINKKFEKKEITVAREKIMIYPPQFTGSAETLLAGIIQKDAAEFRVIHWADTKNLKLTQRPLANVFNFYADLFFNDFTPLRSAILKFYLVYLRREFSIKNNFHLKMKKLKQIISKRPA